MTPSSSAVGRRAVSSPDGWRPSPSKTSCWSRRDLITDLWLPVGGPQTCSTPGLSRRATTGGTTVATSTLGASPSRSRERECSAVVPRTTAASPPSGAPRTTTRGLRCPTTPGESPRCGRCSTARSSACGFGRTPTRRSGRFTGRRSTRPWPSGSRGPTISTISTAESDSAPSRRTSTTASGSTRRSRISTQPGHGRTSASSTAR